MNLSVMNMEIHFYFRSNMFEVQVVLRDGRKVLEVKLECQLISKLCHVNFDFLEVSIN